MLSSEGEDEMKETDPGGGFKMAYIKSIYSISIDNMINIMLLNYYNTW